MSPDCIYRVSLDRALRFGILCVPQSGTLFANIKLGIPAYKGLSGALQAVCRNSTKLVDFHQACFVDFAKGSLLPVGDVISIH